MRLKPQSFTEHSDGEQPTRKFTQVLVIEIDTGCDLMNGQQTPAVCSLLRGIEAQFERSGVQLTKLPWDIKAQDIGCGDGVEPDQIIATVDLVESEVL